MTLVGQGHNHWFIYITIAVAMLLSIWPLPFSWLAWRPPFVSLVLIYWLLHFPQRFGLVFVTIVGLFLDVLQGTSLGVNALGLCLVAYGVLSSQRRLKQFSMFQQCSVAFVLLGIQAMVISWLQALAGLSPSGNVVLISAFWGGILWLPVYIGLRKLSWRLKVD